MTPQDLIALALKEDLPSGDCTTEHLGQEPYSGTASLVAKQDLILSGQDFFQGTMKQMDPTSSLRWHFTDGDSILKGQVVADIHGNLLQILKAERVALNFIGPLSGIATLTKKFVNQCEGTTAKILDTRKTRPLYRAAEKQAVLHGGGTNHRMNLSDQILIKENHLFVGEGLENFINKIRRQAGSNCSEDQSLAQNTDSKDKVSPSPSIDPKARPSAVFIEVEVKNLEEVRQAVKLNVDRIMLDNFDNAQIEKALTIVPKTIQTEASGNMTLDRVASVAALGVDFISVGALTHSAPNADFSLLFHW